MEIRITYCVERGHLDRASALAAAIKAEFGVSPGLRPGHGGIFEVVVDGSVEYTNAGVFEEIPEHERVLQRIRELRPALRVGDREKPRHRLESRSFERPGYQAPHSVGIEFLYVDMKSCRRSRESLENLREALSILGPVLDLVGVSVELREILVRDEDQAQQLGFVSSPTVRVGGRDIAGEIAESFCEDCSRRIGADVYCRVWNYKGRVHDAVPPALLADSVLREAYAGRRIPVEEGEDAAPVPDNMSRLLGCSEYSI